MKKILSILLVVLMVFSLTGCIIRKQPSKSKLIIADMESRYDDEFTYVNSTDGGLDREIKYAVIKSKKHPDWDVRGYYLYGEISDNYLNLKFKKETEDKFEEMLETMLDCDVRITVKTTRRSVGNYLTDMTAFEEFFYSEKSNLGFSSLVHKSYGEVDKKLVEEKIRETFKNNKNLLGNISFAENDIQFDKRDSLNHDAFKGIIAVQFIIDENGKLKFNWNIV